MSNPVIRGQWPMHNPIDIPVQQDTPPNKSVSNQERATFRNRIKWWPVLLLLIAGFIIYKTMARPRTAFRDPLSVAFRLSGNFGELRSNHFHMGLDVRTNGQEGLPVYAVAAGYVSRVIIEENGLGKAVFITHPNGYTTVYAHLNRFYPALEDTVEAKQRSTRQREQDLFFTAGRFPVTRGHLIAQSGNTGGSEAPHLHFEVRDTRTGNNLNPLLHGFNMDDDNPPVITGLYWYNRQYSTYRTSANNISITGGEGAYKAARPVIKVRSPYISLGIRAIDKSNDNKFRFGIYKAELQLDGAPIHEAVLDNFSYTDSRYINACVDYTKWMKTGMYIQHLSLLPGNHLSAWKGEGILDLSDGKPHHVSLRLYDVSNNVTTFESDIQYSGATEDPLPVPPSAFTIVPGKEKQIATKQCTVQFSKAAFYDTVYFALKEQPSTGAQKASALVSLHNSSIPVHDTYKVSLKAAPFVTERLKKRVVMQLNSGKNKFTAKGVWDNNWLTASFNTLGNVQLIIDTIPPTIAPVNWRVFVEEPEELQLLCKDEVAGVANFRAMLDGAWMLFERKGNDFKVSIPKDCARGQHQLTINVTDVAGNNIQQTFSFIK